jgi:hypothetical protein
MEKLGNWLASAWYPIAISLGGLLLGGLLLYFQLGSLSPGFSQEEINQSNAAQSLHAIRENPLNFPHKVLQKGIDKMGVSLLTAGRVASVFMGISIVACFFFVLRNWYTRRVAILATVLFVCSAWFLHTARAGSDIILYSSLIGLVGCAAWFQQSRSGRAPVFAGALLVVTLLYIPGIFWIVVPAFVWQFGRISRFLQGRRLAFLVPIGLLCIVLLTPLVWAFIKNPELIRIYLGLPADWPSPLELAKNIANVPVQIFFRGPDTPTSWLGRLPLVDWFGVIMFAIGTYAYYFKRQLDRTRFVAFIFGMGTLLVGLGGAVTISILLPFVYLIIAGGIGLMLQQWFTVFPRNPVARTTGAVLMTLAVLMSVFYNVNQYFIAWPNAPETKEAFQSADANSLLQ